MRRKILTILCAIALTLTVLPGTDAAEEPLPPAEADFLPEVTQAVDPVPPEPETDGNRVLVGLFYGSDALPGANLKNSVGEGYRLGYLDKDRAFWEVGRTGETSISVVKTQNVWYGTPGQYPSYGDEATSDILVGCWHALVPLEFQSWAEAAGYAEGVGGFPAWIDGAYQVRMGAFATKEEAQALADTFGGAVVGTSAYGVSVVKTGTSQVLFQFDGKREELPLTVLPGQNSGEKTVTYFRGVRYYGGFQYRRIGGGNLTVINVVNMESYVSCLLSQEMSPSWPMEALKAQAVCARNYVEADGKGRHAGFDVCPTTHCQAYPGLGGENQRTQQATAETANLRAWYNGALAHTYYYSSSGGGSEDVKNVWGSTGYPYLCGVIDPYEETVKEKIAYWSTTKTYTATELTELLNAKGYVNAGIVDVKTELSPTGNVKTLIFVDSRGKSWPFVKESGVRNMLGLKSMRYQVEKSERETSAGAWYTDGGGTLSSMKDVYVIGAGGKAEKVSGAVYVISGSGTQALPEPSGQATEPVFTFHVSGWGHSVGMSQWGAYAMASQGKTFDKILKFYYPGIELY